VARPIYEVKAEFFKTLAHPARIRVLEVLSDGERPVNELLPLVGIEPSHLSQQLAVLRRAGIVHSRREGSSVLYEVTEKRIVELLDATEETVSVLSEQAQIDFGDKKPRRKRA
jgi:ArsR family transcriptional regulator